MLIIFILTMFIPIGNHGSNSDCTIELRKNHSISNYIPENSWYHDCSNLTAFDGVGNDTWITEPVHNVTGTMNASGGYIYADDYGFGGFGHGPLRYHTLSSPIRVSQFISLEAELELDASPSLPCTELGKIRITLYDDFEKEVITLNAGQTWDDSGWDSQIEAFARWRFSNGTTIDTPTDTGHSDPYHDTLKICQNETGLFASLPGIGNYSILTLDEVESNRVIKYVAIYIGATFSFSPTDILRVHDLLLSYDSTAPVIQGPDDIHYDEFTTNHSIIWNVSESNPSTYSLYINGTPDSTGEWDGSNFSIDVDNLSLGVYNYTLLLTDVGGSVASDTVFVFVHDGDTPNITSPADLAFEEGSSGQVIEWVVTDEHPANYQILVNGTSQLSGLWNSSGESIAVSLDNISSGIYNYTCCVYDVDNNAAWDSVIVTVTTLPTTTTDTTTTTTDLTSDTTTTNPLLDNQNVAFILAGTGLAVIVVMVIWRRLKR